MKKQDIIQLAKNSGIELTGDITFNEMGLDYQVVFAQDTSGLRWVLRLPRRTNLGHKIKYEAQALKFLKDRVSINIPDWKTYNDHFIAYPMLEEPPVITFDSQTYEVTWNINKDSHHFIDSLAKFLAELHAIPQDRAMSSGISKIDINEERTKIHNEITLVNAEIGIGPKALNRWHMWLDDDSYWPTKISLVHGDLYAGHMLAGYDGTISGIIDWSEVKLGDPSIDFSGHLSAFDKNSLTLLIKTYEHLGGVVWPRMLEHCIERHSLSTLKYAVFALEQKLDQHIEAAKQQIRALEP